MPRLIVSRRALSGIERCERFLLDKDEVAARRASATIRQGLARLQTMPRIGRPVHRQAGLRELPIKFGSSGYLALYSHDAEADAVYILAFRHQREIAY